LAPTLILIALVGVLFFYGSIRLQVAFGEVGLLATQVGLILVPAILFLFVGGYRVSSTLSLRAPSLRSILAAVLIIVGGTPLVWFVTWAQGFVLPVPQEFLEGMTDFLTANSPSRILWLLLLVALTPAVCEEILFRGVLLSGLRGRVSFFTAVLVNGIIFGAFHVPGATVVRFLPSAILGMLLSWVVMRSRSIWTGMLMHFINNGSIVILSTTPWILERLSDPTQGPPPWLLIPAVVSLLAGGFLLEGKGGRMEDAG
jgi:sodium transport system permease protein